jgi:hypothetical protein
MEYYTTDPKTGEFIKVYDVKDCLKSLRMQFKRQEETIKDLQESNRHLREEHYKDDTIKELKYEISLMEKEYRRGFPISEEQEIAIKKWTDNHNKEDHKGLYGCYSYHFYPCSIGVSGVIKCTCGAEFEFQEIN